VEVDDRIQGGIQALRLPFEGESPSSAVGKGRAYTPTSSGIDIILALWAQAYALQRCVKQDGNQSSCHAKRSTCRGFPSRVEFFEM